MSKATRDMFGTYSNHAADTRRNRAFRAWLCEKLGCPIDSCYTTGELIRDAIREGVYGWEARSEVQIALARRAAQ